MNNIQYMELFIRICALREMFLALATLLVLRSIEYKKSRENSSFILTVITAVFLYVVVIYNVFIA